MFDQSLVHEKFTKTKLLLFLDQISRYPPSYPILLVELPPLAVLQMREPLKLSQQLFVLTKMRS